MQDLWQVHYRILSIIFLKKFMELNANSRHDDKNRETCETKYKYCDCFLECTNFKDDLIEYKCLCWKKSY